MKCKSRLIHPGLFITRNLNVAQKIILTGTLLLLPLLTLALLLITEKQQQISSITQKQMGIKYSVELRELLEHHPLHRGLAFSVAQGVSEFTVRVDQQLQRVKETVRSLDEINKRIGKDLRVSEHWIHLRNELTALNSETALNSQGRRFEKEAVIAARRFDEQSRIAREISLMILTVGDNSTLVLDSNMKSFYLMSLMVNQLPNLISTTQTLRGLSSTRATATDKVISGDNYLTTLLGIIEERQKHITIEIEKVLQMNPHLSDQLNNRSEEIKHHLNAYTRIFLQENDRLSAVERFELGSEAIQSIFKLYDDVALALAVSLKKQEENLISDISWVIGGITVCL